VLRCYPELSDGEKMTYIVLKSFAYVGPETFVGEGTLSRARGSTVSTISRHLQSLIKVGLVKVRRRGQGRTNIWIIARIPREKLEQYMADWRPDSTLGTKAQAKIAQNTQVKTPHDPQAEEQESEEPSFKKTNNEGRTQSGSSSPAINGLLTASDAKPRSESSTGNQSVENSAAVENSTEAIVENSGELAELIASAFAVPKQTRSIATFLEAYDPATAHSAFESVLHRLDRGEQIDKPVAYFYTVLKMMQADRDATRHENEQDQAEKQAVALSWARSLLREWPTEQVQAILMDTYMDKSFVYGIMQHASG